MSERVDESLRFMIRMFDSHEKYSTSKNLHNLDSQRTLKDQSDTYSTKNNNEFQSYKESFVSIN